MRDAVRFLLGDAPRTLRQVDPTMTVLDWLRGEAGLTGTKEGCNEGDCGACTVVVARPQGDGLAYRAVNACIHLVGALDGAQLLAVEHLAAGDALHPVQAALVEHHGSQCGFCTPGFVMSLFALGRRAGPAPEEAEIDDALAGNLCRCTGYAPIVRAARAALGAPADDAVAGRPGEAAAALRALADEETVAVAGADGRRFFAPATVDALAALCLEHPDATLVAGATDVGLWVTKELRRLDPVIHLGRVAGLDRIEAGADGLWIGATATYARARAALAALYPDMGEVVRRIGGAQIRNVGTIGGNIANGSPIGDVPPLLIAADATLHLRRGDARRTLPLERFFLAYGKQDRRPGELVEGVSVPRPGPGERFRAYKVSKRFDSDITAVLGAFRLRLEEGCVAEARLAYGGMAATPRRAPAAEAALTGRPWIEDTVRAAMAALDDDFTPIDDWRASAGYRRRVARNLLLRCFLETAGGTGPRRLVGGGVLADG